MGSRGFRERYASLAGDAAPVLSHHNGASEGWPLPRGARYLDTRDGPCSTHDQVYGGDEVSTAYSAFDTCFRGALSVGTHPRDIVFLDTETTGLAGGTGTHVFLVGLGRFSGSRLVV